MNEIQITIRPATADDLLFISKGFHTAMLMDDSDEERIRKFAHDVCAQEGVLYSPKNTVIAEVDGNPVGMLTAYDGAGYHDMRVRTSMLIQQSMGVTFENMEDESQAGEYYLDSLAVLPEYRGRGIGTYLLRHGIGQGHEKGLTVTLAVDPVNENAQRLYKSLGFMHQRDIFIFGHTYWKWAVAL